MSSIINELAIHSAVIRDSKKSIKNELNIDLKAVMIGQVILEYCKQNDTSIIPMHEITKRTQLKQPEIQKSMRYLYQDHKIIRKFRHSTDERLVNVELIDKTTLEKYVTEAENIINIHLTKIHKSIIY